MVVHLLLLMARTWPALDTFATPKSLLVLPFEATPQRCCTCDRRLVTTSQLRVDEPYRQYE